VAVVAAVASIAIVAVAAGATRLFTAHDTAASAPPVNANCTLIVPANALTAQGLATPYQLTATDPAAGPCHEAGSGQTAFVQGAVIDPATGKVSVYNPLVVDQGSSPVVPTVVPDLPAGAVVAVWFGYNGDTLSLAGADQVRASQAPGSPGAGSPAPGSPAPGSPAAAASPSATASLDRVIRGHRDRNSPAASATQDAILDQANCVAGENIGGQFTSFTQVGACNAVAFFQAANSAIRAGKLKVPSPGTAKDGMPCLTTRSFALIDQDQSDNVTTEYLTDSSGRTAQDTAASRQAMTGASQLFNGSDNGLLDLFVDPALGCSPWQAPDLADGGTPSPALPLDELQAAAFAGRSRAGGPAALIPLNDPMTLDGNGKYNVDKTNTYRSIMDMRSLPTGQSPRAYCADMERIQSMRLQQDVNLLTGAPSPDTGAGDTLFTFLASRLQGSFDNLNCGSFGLGNQVSTTADGNGVAVAACFARQVAPVTAGPGNPMAGTRMCPATTGAGPGSPGAGSPGPGTGSQAASGSPAPSASAAPAPTSVRRHHHRHHWWW
jgi:hypothetical protein